MTKAGFLTELMKLIWATAGGSLLIALTADRLTIPAVGQEIVMWTGIALAIALAAIAASVGGLAVRIIWKEGK
jgi:hypothetical protein